MTNAFLPNFTREQKSKGRRAALGLAAEAQIFLILILFLLVVVAEIFMPRLILILAPGFANTPERLAAATDLARVTMPYLPIISVVALWGAIANAHDRFFAAAAAPIVINICFIAGAIAIPLVAADAGVKRAFPVAIGLLVGGMLQLLLLFWALRRLDALPALIWPRLSAAGRKMWRHFLPAALGAAGMQLNLLVDLILASLLPVGAISWLYYADRVVQLPLGVVGIALGTALLPRLSAAEVTDRRADIFKTLDEAICLGGFLVVPAVTALLIMAGPIISGLFTYGAFGSEDAAMAATALLAYSVGLPGFVMIKIMQPAFYAAGQPRTVLKLSILTVAVNISGSLILMPMFGHVGLAFATSLSGLVTALIMVRLLIQQNRLGLRWVRSLGRILAASLIMAAFISGLQYIGAVLELLLPNAVWLAFLVVGGAVSYAGAAHITGAVPVGIIGRFGIGKA